MTKKQLKDILLDHKDLKHKKPCVRQKAIRF